MHAGILEPGKWLEAEARASAVADEIESHLERPAWSVLLDADILVSRFNQWLKQRRLGLANRQAAGAGDDIPAWKMRIVSAGEVFARARSFIVTRMRWCSDRIEGLASKSYQADLSRDLVALIPHASDPVLIANIPERQYLAPLLRRFATPFSGEQYVSLFRRDSIAFLEKGELITTSSKDLVILEIDAHRTKDFELYLRESKRVLREQGRLVVYLHRLGLVWPADEIAENSLAGVVDKLGAEFQVASIRRRGGLGSYLRVRLAAWFRALVSRRLAVRWLLIIFGLPLLPIIMVFGGIFVVATVVLDFFVRSARYWISSLILARNDSGNPRRPVPRRVTPADLGSHGPVAPAVATGTAVPVP